MDPYSVLGVAKDASQQDIKKAYRRIAIENHPDKNSDPKAVDKFKQASDAYSRIGTEEARKEYHDSLRPRGFDHRGPGSVFEEFFGAGFGGSSWEDMFGSHRRNAKPYVIRAKMEFTLEDLSTCPEKTFVLDGQRVSFKIPEGSLPGDSLRVRMQSGQELHVHVSVLPHNVFALKGTDLHTQVSVPIDTALRGGEVKVPTLHGSINLKIPPKTSSHSKLRVRGEGLKNKAGQSGCIIYEVKLDLKKMSPELLAWVSSIN